MEVCKVVACVPKLFNDIFGLRQDQHLVRIVGTIIHFANRFFIHLGELRLTRRFGRVWGGCFES